MEKHYDSEKANKAQIKYCAEKGLPHFAPKRHCHWCGRDIYQLIEHTERNWDGSCYTAISGISVEEASTTLVTGCPHCHRSFCD